MAAVDLALGVPEVITLGLSNVAQEVTFPENARRYYIYFRGGVDGLMYPTGTDGAAINADASTIGGGAWFENNVPGCILGGRSRNLDAATRKAFFASATAAAVLEIRCEP